jgi:hypothetical protein
MSLKVKIGEAETRPSELMPKAAVMGRDGRVDQIAAKTPERASMRSSSAPANRL